MDPPHTVLSVIIYRILQCVIHNTMVYFTATHKLFFFFFFWRVFACVCNFTCLWVCICTPSNTGKSSCFICSGWKVYSRWKDLCLRLTLNFLLLSLMHSQLCVFMRTYVTKVERGLCNWNLANEQLDPQTWILSYSWSCSIYFSIKYEIVRCNNALLAFVHLWELLYRQSLFYLL